MAVPALFTTNMTHHLITLLYEEQGGAPLPGSIEIEV